MGEDAGAYEIELQKEIDIPEFKRHVMAGEGKLWLICIEEGENISRFRGIMRPENKDIPSVRISLDIVGGGSAFVNAASGQALPKVQIAREVARALGATRIFKEGREVPGVDKV